LYKKESNKKTESAIKKATIF